MRADTDRPILRGYLHLASALVSPGAVVLLVLVANSPRSIVGAAIFGASLVVLYWTSASYHLLARRRFRGFMSRLDRSMIFIFIAGAYTPFVLKLMSNAWGIPILSTVGGLALIGFVTTLAAPPAPNWVRVPLYVILGWLGIIGITELVRSLPVEALALLVLGGVLFSIGAATYATKRPNPFPRVFGYHEIFHTLQVVATALLYWVVAVYVI
ncbi:MAG: hemolysin III family protein [Dehalococcoidia bacterium]|nr:hemolysin III family protein [Dehalococcoidia bacterium]